jgi:hypothetical protein
MRAQVRHDCLEAGVGETLGVPEPYPIGVRVREQSMQQENRPTGSQSVHRQELAIEPADGLGPNVHAAPLAMLDIVPTLIRPTGIRKGLAAFRTIAFRNRLLFGHTMMTGLIRGAARG